MTIRKIVSLILLIVFCITTAVPVVNADEERTPVFERYAKMLESIDMFNQTDKGFELERQMTRLEAAVITVRLLGKENEAKEKNYEHPFSDVPQWADPYVGYLYHNKIAGGISDTKYGSDDIISAQQFMVLLLRVMGYDDRKGDFQQDKSLMKAAELNLVSEKFAEVFEEGKYLFIRDDVVYLIIRALNTKVKDSENTLMERLINENVLTLEQALDSGLYKKSLRVEKKGVIIGYRDDSINVIKKMDDGNKWFGDEKKENETKFISRIRVCGDDLKEYEILLQKDYGFDKDSILGKSIAFTGDLVFNMFGIREKTRYIDIDDYIITGLQNDADYEPVVYKGKFLPTGHTYDIGGQTGFTLITDSGDKYSALMGIHKLMDKAQEMAEAKAVGAYVSYNLRSYTNVDLWVKGYKKKNSTLLYVTEFGKDFMWDEKRGQWIKKDALEYGNNLAFATLKRQIENSDDKVIFEATCKFLNAYEEKFVELTFDKNKLGNKVPSEAFINKTIDVYLLPHTDIYSATNIEVQDWYYQGHESTSNCYGTLLKVLNYNNEYIEYELVNSESPIKVVRFYKNDFIGLDFDSLIGKTVYMEGFYMENNIDKIQVKVWMEM